MFFAKDIMTTSLITVKPDTGIAQAAKVLLENHINGVPVVTENGSLVGILCQSDLIAQQKKFPLPSLFTFFDGVFSFTPFKRIEKMVHKITANQVADAMTDEPKTVSPETPLEEVANLMVDQHFHTVPVMEEGELVGIIGKADILKTLLKAENNSTKNP